MTKLGRFKCISKPGRSPAFLTKWKPQFVTFKCEVVYFFLKKKVELKPLEKALREAIGTFFLKKKIYKIYTFFFYQSM